MVSSKKRPHTRAHGTRTIRTFQETHSLDHRWPAACPLPAAMGSAWRCWVGANQRQGEDEAAPCWGQAKARRLGVAYLLCVRKTARNLGKLLRTRARAQFVWQWQWQWQWHHGHQGSGPRKQTLFSHVAHWWGGCAIMCARTNERQAVQHVDGTSYGWVEGQQSRLGAAHDAVLNGLRGDSCGPRARAESTIDPSSRGCRGLV